MPGSEGLRASERDLNHSHLQHCTPPPLLLLLLLELWYSRESRRVRLDATPSEPPLLTSAMGRRCAV
ncbi:unnamed protein product [Lampetra fluviatilis]